MSHLTYNPKYIWLAVALCLACPLAVYPQTARESPHHRILIDRSGSMEGFFATRRMEELERLIRELYGSSGDSYYFIDRDLVLHGQETRFGNNTYLRDAFDNALTQQPAPKILWLLTDNQPSVGNQTDSDRDIEEFYDRLRSDSVKRVYFFPLKLDFNGKLFREDGHTVLTQNYVGKRGVLIYALLMDDTARDEFERVTSEFQSRYQRSGGQLPRILIKPLEQNTITAKLIPGDKFRFDEQNHLVGGDFSEGRPLSGKFDIELTSKLDQMKIVHADVEVTVLEKFGTADFTESTVTPEFSPQVIQDFSPQNKRRIEVRLSAPGVHIKSNPVSWWNCITHNRGDIRGTIRIVLKVRGENLDLVSDLANEFGTTRDIYHDSNERVQSRIYKLDALVRKMMPEREVSIQPRIGNDDGNIPVRLLVRYPKWPAVVLVAGIISLLLFALLLWRLLAGQQLYRLTWDHGQFRACPDFRLWPLISRQVPLDDQTAAKISRTLGGIRVHAASGYTVDQTKNRFVDARGTDFYVSRSSTGAGLDFHFSSATPGLTNSQTSKNGNYDILGDITYGNSGQDSAGISREAATAPPIRRPTTGSGSNGDQATSGKSGESSFNLDDLYP